VLPNSCTQYSKMPRTHWVRGEYVVGVTGFEPATFAEQWLGRFLSSSGLSPAVTRPVLLGDDKGLRHTHRSLWPSASRATRYPTALHPATTPERSIAKCRVPIVTRLNGRGGRNLYPLRIELVARRTSPSSVELTIHLGIKIFFKYSVLAASYSPHLLR